MRFVTDNSKPLTLVSRTLRPRTPNVWNRECFSLVDDENNREESRLEKHEQQGCFVETRSKCLFPN
jgi:hypothetical protein